MRGRTRGFRNPRGALPAARPGGKDDWRLPRRTRHRRERCFRCPRSISSWHLDFLGAEEEEMSRLAEQSQVAAGIVFQNYRDVRLAFVVLFKRLNDGSLTGKREIKHIAAGARAKAHDVAWPQFDARNQEA